VKGRECVAATVLEKKPIKVVDDCVKTIYSPNPLDANRTHIVKAAKIRIYSTCPASGNVFVRIASHDGLGFGLLPPGHRKVPGLFAFFLFFLPSGDHAATHRAPAW